VRVVNNQLRNIATMIQLFDSVYLLDGTVGKRPIYLPLLVGEQGCLLLDTGCSYHVDALIIPALDQLQIRPDQLRYIVNTHPDSDHVGGNAGMKHWSPKAIVSCGDADRFQIDDPSTLFATRYDAYRAHGVFYPEEVKTGILKDLGEPQPVELTFRGGERLRLGPDWDLEVLSLPGHSKGHLGILDHKHRVLFGGDAIQGSVYLGVDGQPALCPTYLYPESYLLTNQFIEHLDIDLYVSCHWPLKKGSEIAEFCRETRDFVERAETLVRLAQTDSLAQLCDRLGPQLGQWPEPVNRELAYALAGHLKLQ
jgi:glyoxylase-like metal-dependent hydrolase (beta-lactamase superfamily II)